MAPFKIKINPAKLISSLSYQQPDKLLITELLFSVPLDHAKPDGRHIRIFGRTAEPYKKPIDPADNNKPSHLPLISYIQGGPGFGIGNPAHMPCTSILLEKGYKFVCLDHRGMGLSNTVTAATLAREGDDTAQADYLTYFRAPYAVQDLEAIRLCMTEKYPEAQRKWSIMGQSYGGWVSTNYLSTYPEGLRESFIFGGLPPVFETSPEKTVRRSLKILRERNEKYYAKFPGDVDKVKKVVEHLKSTKVVLPDGGALSAARFLEIGIGLGMKGGIDEVHTIVMRATNDLEMFGELTRPTLEIIVGFLPFETAVLYALMHEAIYCQGEATNWTFDRIVAEDHDFDSQQDKQRYSFTGEMVFSRCFDENSELRSLKGVAEILHQKKDWPDLYDIDQLKRNEVPIHAAVYHDDMYVARETSMQTASTIKNCKVYLTNQMHHDAVRAKAQEVLSAVFALRDDCIE